MRFHYSSVWINMQSDCIKKTIVGKHYIYVLKFPYLYVLYSNEKNRFIRFFEFLRKMFNRLLEKIFLAAKKQKRQHYFHPLF